MSPRRLVLWRHGETDYNAAGRMQGHLDSALTPRGWNQARFAVPALARFSPDLVIASDLRRATDTATVLTDAFVIASASNERLVGAIVDNVEEKLRESGHKPVRREGAREGRWVLLDYVDVVVHVQHVEERTFYGLERLWKDCPRIEVAGLEEPPSDEDPDVP